MKIGGLFFGYGGLDLAVQQVLGGELAWVSEIDKGACKVIEHRFPGVPNLGDITTVKWAPDCPACGGSMAVYRRPTPDDALGEWASEPFYWCSPCETEWDTSVRHADPEAHLIPEPVDVLTGGSPCQDLSHAGKRAGMAKGTRSNLWVAMREAIAVLRPSLVVWENVRGAYSAAADSAVEPCAGCVGDGSGVHLRALGRVLGDLSDLGYDAQWHGLRAADVGAPHGRFRVFVTAYAEHDGSLADSFRRRARTGADPRRLLEPQGSPANPTLLSTPQSRDYKGVPGDGFNQANLARDVSLLPTPAVNDMGEGKTVEQWDAWTDAMKAKHGNGNGHGASLAIETQRLLATPRAFGSRTSRHAATTAYRRSAPSLEQQVEVAEGITPREIEGAEVQDSWRATWGDYADAIDRWVSLTRPAPSPTELGPKGSPRLSARFSEWMMGLPDGWITDVPGITRNEALKACGNGVVPQQAAAALRVTLTRAEVLL